jgi:hypothetical protein
MDKIRLLKKVMQKPDPRNESGPTVTLGNDLEVLDLQQVTATGTFYVNGAS